MSEKRYSKNARRHMTRHNMQQAMGRLEREFAAIVMQSPADTCKSRSELRIALAAMRRVKALWRGYK